MDLTTELSLIVGKARACGCLELPRASFYRWRNPPPAEARPRPTPARALTPPERQKVLETLNGERFMDKAPREAYATLLDEGECFCSIRTMYRILEDNGEVRERRDQLRHRNFKKPELLATGPNQVWSWDITKLLGPQKWNHYMLYVIIDIFSRYVVGWMLASRESDALAKKLIGETIEKEKALPSQLTIHSDRGPSMTSKSVALLLADLGVIKSHSRPHVSDDNPFSEAQFKTLKYRPEFPDRFGSIQDARSHSQAFFQWYNSEHRHEGIAMLTPEVVHSGRAGEVLRKRQEVLNARYAANPERFVHGAPKVPALPEAVWINPPAAQKGDHVDGTVSQEPPCLSGSHRSDDPALAGPQATQKYNPPPPAAPAAKGADRIDNAPLEPTEHNPPGSDPTQRHQIATPVPFPPAGMAERKLKGKTFAVLH